MHTYQLLALLAFITATVCSAYTKAWPLLFIALGLALEITYPVTHA